MSKESITKKYFLEDTPDNEIDVSDIPSLGKEFWENAKVRWPKNKKVISIRLDEDVLAFFQKQGKGYQSKINAVLRSYVEYHRKSV